MIENPEKLQELVDRLDALVQQHQNFVSEITALRAEIFLLKQRVKPIAAAPPVEATPYVSAFRRMDEPALPTAISTLEVPTPTVPVDKQLETGIAKDIEKFIGENLINKIGIAVLIIGVAIGAKYSIEHKLISPATRIIAGYLMGAALAGFGIKLKNKYIGFSAVLVSGAISIVYFITYAAYSFYALMPQPVAFAIMVLLTITAVWTAIKYNRQVIAHIGLVGAYAVPLLIGDDKGQIAILFSYIAIINAGILAISFVRYWKPLLYSSFFVTWLIFISWFVARYNRETHLMLVLGFGIVYFLTFYLSFLWYKLFKKERFLQEDVVLIVANAFLFFGIGYTALSDHDSSKNYLTLFTISNALVHLLVSQVVRRYPAYDKQLFYLLTGLSILFATVAIPVYFDGKPVTLLWAGEAALLFWIGRMKAFYFYEKLSYPVMGIAFLSLLQNWGDAYISYNYLLPVVHEKPLLNPNFLTSIMFAGFFGFINYINRNKKPAVPETQTILTRLFSVVIPAMLLLSLFYAFYFEIGDYWNQLYRASLPVDYYKNFEGIGNMQQDLQSFKTVWLINYSLLFVSLLAIANLFKIKNRQLSFVNLVLNELMIVLFLAQSLYSLGTLRESYLAAPDNGYSAGIFNISIRYLSYVFVAMALYTTWRYVRSWLQLKNKAVLYDGLLHGSIIWIASSELINLMQLAHSEQSYKLGLSILWGVYALGLIVLGISQGKKHLRVGAIALFAVTLIKLFFYDLASLDSIGKTIVLVALGILLLIISFLYNKYKNLIAGDKEDIVDER